MITSLNDLISKIDGLINDCDSLCYSAYENGFSADVTFGIHNVEHQLCEVYQFLKKVNEYKIKKTE